MKGGIKMDKRFDVRTPSHACLVDITAQVERFVSQSAVAEGTCHVFVPHTTAGITINENADPTVQSDILREMDKIVPWGDTYDHDEGNSAAHIKASLFGSSQTMFVSGGKLQLGTWQGIYLAEFDGPRTRQVWVKIIAD
jgi:secondary thiamine-phosphate synthase enzyme